MRVLVSPDSFKESLTARQVAGAIVSVLHEYNIETKSIPVADGGEGTVDSLVDGLGGQIRSVKVKDPLGHDIMCNYGLVTVPKTGKTAIIEMASSSGLMLIAPNERNPLISNTYGLGQLILDVLDNHVHHIIMGIGGSATNDGGAGMLRALGVRFLDKDGTKIVNLPSKLSNTTQIDLTALDSRIKNVSISVACDVDNPLLGDNGATSVYGPQKGVQESTHPILESALSHFANLTHTTVGIDHKDTAGAGAAGGLGFALISYLGAELVSGIELVLQTVDFESHAQWADIIITGEGKIDSQTINGKTPAGVAKHAFQFGKPTLVLAGSVTSGWESLKDIGVYDSIPITPEGMDLPTALRTAEQNLINTTHKIIPVLQRMKNGV